MAANQLALAARASAVGKVTGLESVSGKIIASTFEKKIVVICALTARVLDVMESSHKSFMCGITKVRRRETASLWTYSNDGGVQTWELQGNFVKVKEGTKTLRKKLSKLSVTNHLQQLAENVQLGVNVQEEKNKYINFRDDLRTAREEAQELRLKLIKLQEELEVKKEEVLKGETRVKELEADNAKCKKDVTEFSEKVSSVEKERAALQSEVGTLKEDLSKARTEVSDKIAENSKVSQEVSLAKTEKSQMEQRLHDAEGKLATIEGENTRLCRSIGSVAAAQGAERDVQNQILKGSEQSRSELERVMKLNKVLSSALASMEYTIRKKEEEEKDLTALLNAYRRKVADRVSDPHLSALLIATMVRNPARFDLECDDITKGELLDRNGPFIQFIHSLRDTDFDAYNKMMEYLQQSSDGTLPPEAHELLDRFLSLATTEGVVSGEVLNSFKRSIPSNLHSSQIAGQLQPSLDALNGPSSSGGASAVGYGGSGTSNQNDVPAYLKGPGAPFSKEDELVTTNLLREIRSQKNVDENYVKEHQVLFEFILQTRRALVERLALLQKRTVSAKQVVEALSVTNQSSPLKKSQSLQSVFVGIIQELVELSTDVVMKYFTNAERQRLNIQ
ncbi:hypothetical protein AGDE_05538 [Angomonas deanei]|uniref:Uncharacterized protein n=1 Tax=Angomonas deanei TaxID=59799 RepID=A0A7G2CU95_9TRYP|nr:hypothetical protein AGDE_05538 [Angomonas deanei]CAD2222043.1 hypothetical protein, conserved [Angomonas deanei]|eukprot:EPY38391.1 hypothetical protein AGDE_05538 [Angomonas deanei]